jgi:transcriptional regulator with XRE-family HTH domain
MTRYIIGANIKRCRMAQGFKQETFAKEIGISRIMLSRYENGRSVLSSAKLADIAKFLQVPVVILLSEAPTLKAPLVEEQL